MSAERARAYLEKLGAAHRIKTYDESTATVELAAKAAGVIPARIAKTLCFKMGEGALLVVAAGDARVDNKKFKARFGTKASMLPPEEVERLVGHSVGGVCPFGINEGISVYLDDSLKRFETVLPAAGSANNCIELNLEELFELSGAEDWVDVCKTIANN